MTIRRLVVASFGLLLPLLAAAQAAPAGFHVARSIAIGGEGGWDYLTVDSAAHRLYVSHATRVHVVDTEKGAVVGEIPDTQGVHGIALAPELGRGFVSNGRANSVTVFDLKTLVVIATVTTTGENPDAICFDPATRRVFTFNARSANTTAIDAVTNEVVGTLTLPGKPEFAVSDGRGKMFVNIEDKSLIVAFDPKALAITGQWPIAPCEEPSGLALDRERRRLFAVGGNQLMAVVDAESGKLVATVPIGSGVDGVAFDPSTGLVFSSNGEGTLTVIHENSPEKYTIVATVPTKRGARTIALDATTHRIYLPTAQFGPPPSPTVERPHPRPSIVPGTFEILVVER
jgi:YVTN family beta-propeller protein